MATETTVDFSRIQYSQSARVVPDLEREFGMYLDPEMPKERVKYIAPIYETRADGRHCCVPVDAEIGDRIVAADVWDSGTRLHLFEISALDDAIGDEMAPWEPRRKVRRAMLKLIDVGRSHMDRMHPQHAPRRDFWKTSGV